jgi:hypothetical protein
MPSHRPHQGEREDDAEVTLPRLTPRRVNHPAVGIHGPSVVHRDDARREPFHVPPPAPGRQPVGVVEAHARRHQPHPRRERLRSPVLAVLEQEVIHPRIRERRAPTLALKLRATLDVVLHRPSRFVVLHRDTR